MSDLSVTFASGLVAAFFFFSLISMSPETIVEFLFVTIETGVGTRQAVPLVRAVAQILCFHVGFIVEVGHFPSVLLLVVVVGVGRVVGRGDRLGVRCR